MNGRVEMLIERSNGVELPVTDIALPVPAVECTACSRVLTAIIFMPFEQFVGDDSLRVTAADQLVNSFTIQR